MYGPAAEVEMKVKDIMTTTVACCTPDATLQEVARAMCDFDCGEIPVVDGRDTMRPVGVITDRDIACRAVAANKNVATTTVSECMTSPCVSIGPDAGLDACCAVMERYQIRRVLVTDQEGRCCGIVSQADVANAASKENTANVVKAVSKQRLTRPGAPAIIADHPSLKYRLKPAGNKPPQHTAH
jgi:CBS domain-containing protein